MQYDINREAAKTWALSSSKIYKHHYITGKEILSSDQSGIIEQANIAYSPLGRAFEKQIKTIEDQGIKTEINWRTFSEKTKHSEIKNEINEIEKFEKKINPKDLKNETSKYIYDFQLFETIRSFGDDIYTGKISMKLK